MPLRLKVNPPIENWSLHQFDNNFHDEVRSSAFLFVEGIDEATEKDDSAAGFKDDSVAAEPTDEADLIVLHNQHLLTKK